MKLIRHDYRDIHNAMNKMIIAEVKAALALLPGKRISWDGKIPLCHVILSPSEEYIPRDVKVIDVSIDDELGGVLVVAGFNDEDASRFAINWFEDETDWLDIKDFGYLLDQIASKLEGDRIVNLPTKCLTTTGYVTEWALRQTVDRTVTV